jgi:hypothetical protein
LALVLIALGVCDALLAVYRLDNNLRVISDCGQYLLFSLYTVLTIMKGGETFRYNIAAMRKLPEESERLSEVIPVFDVHLR